jgi:hypothetical protein
MSSELSTEIDQRLSREVSSTGADASWGSEALWSELLLRSAWLGARTTLAR